MKTAYRIAEICMVVLSSIPAIGGTVWLLSNLLNGTANSNTFMSYLICISSFVAVIAILVIKRRLNKSTDQYLEENSRK